MRRDRTPATVNMETTLQLPKSYERNFQNVDDGEEREGKKERKNLLKAI
jgi:hypothetical protein